LSDTVHAGILARLSSGLLKQEVQDHVRLDADNAAASRAKSGADRRSYGRVAAAVLAEGDSLAHRRLPAPCRRPRHREGLQQFLLAAGVRLSTATDTLKSIFKEKNVEVTALQDFKSVTDTPSEQTCQAYVETPEEWANIDYRIYREGFTTKVMITEVKAQPK
jgi:hypothetical protein